MASPRSCTHPVDLQAGFTLEFSAKDPSDAGNWFFSLSDYLAALGTGVTIVSASVSVSTSSSDSAAPVLVPGACAVVAGVLADGVTAAPASVVQTALPGGSTGGLSGSLYALRYSMALSDSEVIGRTVWLPVQVLSVYGVSPTLMIAQGPPGGSGAAGPGTDLSQAVVTYGTTTETMVALAGAVITATGAIGTLQTSLTGLAGTTGSLSTSVGTLSTSVGSLTGSVSSLSGTLGTLSGTVSTLNTSVGSLTGTISSLSGEIGTLAGQFGTFSTTVASTAAAGLARAKSGGVINFDTLGVADILDGGPISVIAPVSAGSPTPTWSPSSALINRLMRSVCDITAFGPVGNSTTGDDATVNAAIAWAQNLAATWGVNVKGLSATIRIPPGQQIYLAAPVTISGAIVLEGGGKTTCHIKPLNPATTRFLLILAMDGSGGNNYPGAGAPKGSITIRGLTLWNGGAGSTGLYGPDLVTDPSGVKQMSCPWFSAVPNDAAIGNTGTFTIAGPNGENGPICSANLPASRYRVDFTGPNTFVVTLLYVQGGARVQYQATGTAGNGIAGPLCTVSDINGNWLCQLTINSTVASVAGDIAYFINGCSAIYCTTGAVALKPFIELDDFQIYSFGGCGILADPSWAGQIRGYFGCVVKGCGADGLFGVTLYDGSEQNWEIASNGWGVSLFKCATNKIMLCNVFSNTWHNIYIVGAGGTGPIVMFFAEIDHCQRGHGVYINLSGGTLIHIWIANGNLTGQVEPNMWFTFWIGAACSQGNVVLHGSADQSSYVNSVTSFNSYIIAAGTTNSTSLTVPSLTGLSVGMYVAGAGIVNGTTIVGPLPTSGTTIALSLPATVPAGSSISFINSSQTSLGAVGFENITSTPQVDATTANRFLDSPPVWGQCVGGTGAGGNPIFLTNPNFATTAEAASSNSTTLVINNVGAYAGMTAVGTGIPAGTYVVSAVPNVLGPSSITTVTLSQPATVAINAPITFQPISPPVSLATVGASSITGSGKTATTTVAFASTSALVAGMIINGPGVPIGATVATSGLTSTTVTMAGGPANIPSGTVLSFQAPGFTGLPAGVHWGPTAPRHALATMTVGSKWALALGSPIGGNDGFYGFLGQLSKSANLGPLWTVLDPTGSGVAVPLSLDGSGTGGLIACPGGGPLQLMGPLVLPNAPTGIIVANGTAANTVIAAPGQETIAGTPTSTSLGAFPGLHKITGTGTTAVALMLPGMAALTAAGALNQPIAVKDVDGNASNNPITITAPGTTTIDGATSIVINTNRGGLTVYADGSNFYVLA